MKPGNFRLLVGLGNPGAKFIRTRHNIGFMALEKFARTQAVSFRSQRKLYGQLAEINTGGNRVKLLMPNTFMNESGKSIRATLDWFDLSVDQLLIVVDDIDIPLGKIRLRSKGSAGGHNGLLSSINHLGTQDFCRLRIGIGSPICLPNEKKSKTISHVLGKFSVEESHLVEEVLEEVVLGFDLIQRLGIDKAGNHLNSFKPKESPLNP